MKENSNNFSLIDGIISDTDKGKISWDHHPEIPSAYYFQFKAEGGQIHVIVDTYKAIYNQDLVKCINFSIINWTSGYVMKEIVRCKDSSGVFFDEFTRLEKLYQLAAAKEAEKIKNINELHLV